MKNLFYKIWKNLAQIFYPKNWIWHVLAIALTYIIVASNFDWTYYLATRSPTLLNFMLPALALGMFFPILLPLFLLIYGKIKKNATLFNAGLGIGQAAILGEIISSAYKAFTGRIPPPPFSAPYQIATNISHGFQFGFLRGGVFWGWPSSHTTVAFALALAAIMLYKNRKFIVGIALIYAFYIGIAVSMTIHWLSEFVAGAIIGTVIGIVVGKTFSARAKTLRTQE